MAVDTSNAASEIRTWLSQNVTGGEDIPEDYPLIDKGVLTSLQTVELLMFMEEEFGVTVEDEDLTEDNFATVADIAALVSAKSS